MNLTPTFYPLADAGALMEHVNPHAILTHPLFTLPNSGLFHYFGKEGSVYFTNHIAMMFVSAILMILIFPWIAGKSKKSPVPTGIQNFFEAIMSFLRTEVFRPALGANTDRFVPYLWTLFFFILFCNLVGLMPIPEVLQLINYFTGGALHTTLWDFRHFGGTATGDIMITAGLAIITFFAVHISGITQQVRILMDPSLDPHHGHHHGVMGGEAYEGEDTDAHDTHDHHAATTTAHAHADAHAVHAVAAQSFGAALPTAVGKYIWNFAPHPDTGNKVGDLFLWGLLLVLESIGALVKPFALTVRLFANMLAGHLVLAALVALVFLSQMLAVRTGVGIVVILGCTAMSILELFVAFLQAYIFTFLTTLFLASAVAPEH